MKDSYYTKKKVFGDNPLKEIIYELEDAYEWNAFLDLQYISKEKLQDILIRHSNTVQQFKEKLAKLIN